MKIRNGFVSNSSSSSFVIKKRDITALQRDQIHNHIEEGKKMLEQNPELKLIQDFQYWSDEDAWSISESLTEIRGYTSMDNFDMYTFLDLIGVSSDKIEWGTW